MASRITVSTLWRKGGSEESSQYRRPNCSFSRQRYSSSALVKVRAGEIGYDAMQGGNAE